MKLERYEESLKAANPNPNPNPNWIRCEESLEAAKAALKFSPSSAPARNTLTLAVDSDCNPDWPPQGIPSYGLSLS